MKTYYHATSAKNIQSIIRDGIIYKGFDGIVYMAESIDDALKFTALRYWTDDIYVVELSGLDESKVVETFDHSYAFFKCNSYGYTEDITTDHISNVYVSQKKVIS